eukprot:g5888.t1
MTSVELATIQSSAIELESPAAPEISASDVAPVELMTDAMGSDEITPELTRIETSLGSGDVSSASSFEAAGSGSGGAGSGSGASFFGLEAQGRRFAYIVDRSASMNADTPSGRTRMELTQRELDRSIAGLLESAEFFVVFYSNAATPLGSRRIWSDATERKKLWARRELYRAYPDGGTQPMSGFDQVFSLRPPPDAIYFMTDGRFLADVPERIEQLNRRSRIPIHSIMFGEFSSSADRDEGVSVMMGNGTSVLLDWTRVRDVAGSRADQFEEFRGDARAIWRASVRLERDDLVNAEPLLEDLFARYGPHSGASSSLVASGLLRCRIAAGARAPAVEPWLGTLRADRWAPGVQGGGAPSTAIDAATGLAPSIAPIWLDDDQSAWLVRHDPTRVVARGAGPGPERMRLAALGTLYRVSAMYEQDPGDRDAVEHELRALFDQTDPETLQEAGVGLVREIVLSRVGNEEQRASARTALVERLARRPEAWTESWIRVAIGRSMILESDAEVRRRGVVQLLHAPARFATQTPELAAIALAQAAVTMRLADTTALVLAQTAPEGASKTLLEYIAAGREIGLVIILLSLAAVGMIVAQLLRLRRSRLAPPETVDRLHELLRTNQVGAAIEFCTDAENDSFLARVIGSALIRCSRSPFGFLELKSAIEDVGQAQVARLYRMTDGIGLVASVAPMLGLLGTVVGMVSAFDTIALTEGPARPDQLGGSISQALVTTVLGLIVAIPCTAAFTFLRNRIDTLVSEVGETIEELAAAGDVRLTRADDERIRAFDLTPMIDVVLQLIIFFMFTSQFGELARTLVDLPREAGQEDVAPKPTLAVDLTREGVILLEREAITLDGLAQMARLEIERAGDADLARGRGRAPLEHRDARLAPGGGGAMNLTPKSGRRRGGHLGALTMTSMIDVVFLLLIFFLVTSSFAPDEGRIDSALQTEGNGSATSDLQPQIVSVEWAGRVVVFRVGQRTTTSPQELTSILRQLPREAGVAVRVSGDVPVGAAATAMQSAHDAGFEKRSYEASAPDERVGAYLERLALDELLGVQLRERMARADEDERVLVAERLAALYTRRLAGAATDEERALLASRSSALLEAIPEGRLFDLRISLAIAIYLPGEEIAERARLALASDEEVASAVETLGDVRESMLGVASASDREIAVLERRERSPSESVRLEAQRELGQARRVRSLSRYYAGWAGYYGALLEDDASGASRAVRDFGFLLDSTEQRPTLERLPMRLLQFEHVSRAAIGVALCFSLEQRHNEAVRWIDALARAPELAPEARDQLRAAGMVVLAGASEWGALSDMVGQRRRAGSGFVALPEGEARLLAVLALNALREGGLSRSDASSAEALAQIAVGDLSASGSVAHVLDLATRYDDLPIGDKGFIFRYASGLRLYREARERHGAMGRDDTRPTQDEATARVYEQAAESLARAIESADSGRYPDQRDECRLTLGLSLFYSGELSMAARELARASESEIQRVHDEASWMRVVALDVGVEGGDETLRARRDEAAGEYLRLHPRSRRSAMLVMRLADASLVGDEQAAEILASVPPDAPHADAARRHLARLLYRLYRGAGRDARESAGARFLSVAIPLIEGDERVATESRADVGERAAQSMLVRSRQVLDVVLGVETLDVRHAERAVGAIERVAQARGTDLSSLGEELLYRRLQIALRKDEASEADRLLGELWEIGGRYADAADRLMYQRALVAWSTPPRKGDEAKRLIRFGVRVIESLGASDPNHADSTTLGVYDSVADAAAYLAREDSDSAMAELALSLDQRLLDAGRQTASSLRRVAQLGEQRGQHERALSAWLLLMGGADEGSVAWYEARYHSIRLMLLIDTPRAREAMGQFRVLHPGTAPPPWDERLGALEAQIMLAPEDAGRGGPFALLGLRPGELTDAQILGARDQRMREIDAHRLAETPEADEVRLSLYAATAQLLNPAIRRQLSESWGSPGERAQAPEARPGLSPGSPEQLLEHDAILALAMFGGWNQRSLRHIASIAHARGLSSQDVARTLRRIGRQRRPRRVVGQTPSQRRTGTSPASPVAGAPQPAKPVSLLEPLPEQIDPAQHLIKMALLVASVAAVTLVVLFAGVYAVVSTDRQRAEAAVAEDAEAPASESPGTMRRAPIASAPPSPRTLPAPEFLGDPALVTHELESARRGLELAPYESTRRFARVVGLLAESWVVYSPDELDAANTGVEVYLASVVSPDVARLALDAVGAGAVGLDDPSRTLEPEDVGAAIWSAGMLAELRRNPVLDATRRQQIDRLRRGIAPGGRRDADFASGAVLGAYVIGERLVGDGADLPAWRRWVEAVDALGRSDESLRTDMLSSMLDALLASEEPREGRAEVARELALAMSWRRHEGARRWLVLALNRESASRALLAGLIETLVRESAAQGLDATMALDPNATMRERHALAKRLTDTWRLGRDDQAASAVQDLAEIIRSAERERARPGDAISRFGASVRLAYANAGASLARQERFEDAARALESAAAYRPERSRRQTADPLRGVDDGRWALSYLAASDSPDERLAALDRLSKRMNDRLGPVDAETLTMEALRGAPRQVRERAQSIAARFVASPAMVNALLEQADDLPASAQVMQLVELATARPLDRSSNDGSWRQDARRDLLRALMEMLAREGEGGAIDLMAGEIESAYALTLGQSDSEDAPRAEGQLPEAARSIALRYLREARSLGGAPGLALSPGEIERKRRSRLALADSSMQRFLAEQISVCESLALLASSERGGVAGEVGSILETHTRELRSAPSVLDQITATELAIARLWLGDAEAGTLSPDRLGERMSALSPDSPALYLELGEEVGAMASAPRDLALARRLFVLALTTAIDADNRAIAGGACLALSQMAESDRERRWLAAMAREVDDRIRSDQTETPPEGVDSGLEASLAISRVRSGEGRIARRTIESPDVRRALRAHTTDAWVSRLEDEARRWPCPECRNDRFVPDPDRAGGRRLCATCAGNPGPALTRAELLEHLRIEAALLGVEADSWAAQLAMGRDEPLREADPREVAPYYSIDPALTCWRDNQWVACPEAEDVP